MSIGAQKFSGLLECVIRSEGSDPVTSYLSRLGKNLKYRRRKSGFYVFKGGAIQPFQLNYKAVESRLTLKFKESKVGFIDRIVEAATEDADRCKLMCSLRCENLHKLDKLNNYEPDNIEIIIYPEIDLLSVQGVFERDGTKPGETLEKIFSE